MSPFSVDNSSRRGGGNVGNAVVAFSKEEGKSPPLVFGDFPSSVISIASVSTMISHELRTAVSAYPDSSAAKDDGWPGAAWTGAASSLAPLSAAPEAMQSSARPDSVLDSAVAVVHLPTPAP